MTKFARVVSGSAVDVTADDPTNNFHPDVAGQFVSVPDQVQNGWLLDGKGAWKAPDAPAAPAPAADPQFRTTLAIPEFLMQFTSSERVAIRASTDAGVQDFMLILNDPRLQTIDVVSLAVASALDLLTSKNLIAADRAAAIAKGVKA